MVIFRNDTYQLCDTVRVIITSTLPELPLMNVSPKEITVTNGQETRQIEVTVACRVRDVFNSIDTEIVSGNEDNWLSGAGSYDTETADGQFSRTYIFEYAPNYTSTDREAKIVVKSEYYGLCDTVAVTSLSELPRFEVDKKEITLTNDQEPRQFDVTLLTIPEFADGCNYRIVTQEENEWLWLTKIDRETEGQVTMGFEFSPNYTGRNREALIVFYSEEYNIADTTRVLSIGELLKFEATPKDVTVTNSDEDRRLAIDLAADIREVLETLNPTEILCEGDKWLHLVEIGEISEEGTSFMRHCIFEFDPNFTDVAHKAKVVFSSEQNGLYNVADTVNVTLQGEQRSLTAEPHELSITNALESHKFSIKLVSNDPDATDNIIVQIPDADWLWNVWNWEGEHLKERNFVFEFTPNYTGIDKVCTITFQNETFGLRDSVKVTLVADAGLLRIDKKELHIVNVPDGKFAIPVTTSAGDGELRWELLGNNTGWLNLEYGIADIRYDMNETGQDREAWIAVYYDAFNLADTAHIIQHPINVPTSGVMQPGGGVLEIEIENGAGLESAVKPNAEYVHAATPTVRGNNLVLAIEVDSNNVDEERFCWIDVDIMDSHCNFGLNQGAKSWPSAAELRAALTDYYHKTNGDNWSKGDGWAKNKNWLTDKPLSQWEGLGSSNMVGDYGWHFDLGNANAIGEMPSSLATLMWGLNTIGGNGMYGTIPEAVRNHPRWQSKGWDIILQDWHPSGRLLECDGTHLQFDDRQLHNLRSNSNESLRDMMRRYKMSILQLGAPNDAGVNQFLSYKNKGLGIVCINVSDNDLDALSQFPEGIEFTQFIGDDNMWNFSFGSGLGAMGSSYIADANGDAITYVRFGGDIIDSLLQARLGEPEEHPTWHRDMYTSTDYSRDGEVVVLQKATVGKGVDIVLMGDAYVDRDMEPGGKYEEDMRFAMESLFAVEPYKSLRDRFNVYMVKVVSPNEDIVNGEIRLGQDDGKCLEYAQKIEGLDMDHVAVVQLKNDDSFINVYTGNSDGRGYCSLWGAGLSVSYLMTRQPDYIPFMIISVPLKLGRVKY